MVSRVTFDWWKITLFPSVVYSPSLSLLDSPVVSILTQSPNDTSANTILLIFNANFGCRWQRPSSSSLCNVKCEMCASPLTTLELNVLPFAARCTRKSRCCPCSKLPLLMCDVSCCSLLLPLSPFFILCSSLSHFAVPSPNPLHGSLRSPPESPGYLEKLHLPLSLEVVQLQRNHESTASLFLSRFSPHLVSLVP